MDNLIIPPILGLVGMLMAFVVYKLVMKYPDGEDKVKKIGDQIHGGALAFMKTEYKYLSISLLLLLVLLGSHLVPIQLYQLLLEQFVHL